LSAPQANVLLNIDELMIQDLLPRKARTFQASR
jgi:hypothetical protein